MADYYPLLARALDGLADRSREVRATVYDRARAALATQLASIRPALSAQEIERERAALEDAIVRAEELEGREAEGAMDGPERPVEPEADDRPRVDPRPQQPAIRRGGRRGRPLWMAVGLVAVIAPIAVVAWLLRDQPGIPAAEAPRPTAPAPQLTEPKFPERVGGAGPGTPVPGMPGSPGGTPQRPAAPTAPAGGAPQPSGQPATPGPVAGGPTATPPVAGAPRPTASPQPSPAAPQPPEQAPPAQPDLPVVQRAALLEEDTANPQQPKVASGRVLWRLDALNGGQGQPLETVARSNVEVPEAGLSLGLVMRRNRDATLPASHTIELTFTTRAGDAGRAIRDVGLPMMQTDDRSQSQGIPLAGLPVPVKDNVFLIGLSDLRTDIDRNTDLILKRDWMQIPLRFASGQRAVLVFEKGASGDRVLIEAFKQWLQP